MLRSRLLAMFALAAIPAFAASPARAQCGPDGLTGPCCGPTFATLPQIPGLQRDARFLCFDACNTSLNAGYCVNLGPPVQKFVNGQPLCGVYDIRVRLRFCGTQNFVWLGAVTAFYTRNWIETPAVGQTLNVWRFAINGDLIPTNLLPPGPCDRPACLNNFTRVYFSGYIDYALDCATNTWQVAFTLNHECDAVHHQTGFSRPAPPGGLHPTRSFSIVCPGAGFVPYTGVAGLPRSDGTITAEAIRWNNWASPPPQACSFEEPVNGGMLAQNEFCFCVTSGPAQYIATVVDAVSVCASQAVPSPLGMFMQKRVGNWTAPGAFPGVEYTLFDFGWLAYRNGCSGTNTQEWFEGGETVGGYPATGFGGALLDREFEDWGSCNVDTVNLAPRIGAPHFSSYLIYLNLP